MRIKYYVALVFSPLIYSEKQTCWVLDLSV